MTEQQYTSTCPVLVTAATGQIGSRVVHGLLARGVRVRALARDVGRAAYPADAGAEIVAGEVLYQQVDVERFVGVLEQAGQPEWLARGVAELVEHMDSDVTDAVATAVGRAPIAFKQFAREHKDAFGLPVSVPFSPGRRSTGQVGR